jgi:hypothetical protein
MLKRHQNTASVIYFQCFGEYDSCMDYNEPSDVPTYELLDKLYTRVFIHHASLRTGDPALLRSEFEALHDLLNATHTTP